MASKSAQHTAKEQSSKDSSSTILKHSSSRSSTPVSKLTASTDLEASKEMPEPTGTADKMAEGTAPQPSETEMAASPASTSANPAYKAGEMAQGTAPQPSETEMAASPARPSSSSPSDESFGEAAALDYDEGHASLFSDRQSTTATTLTMEDYDVFEDAEDEEAPPDLQASFDDCNVAIKKFFNNDIRGAKAIMRPWSHVSVYHSLGLAIFEFIPALLTFDKIQMIMAVMATKNCIKLCEKHRRTFTLAQSLGSIVKRHNYANYTDMEAHSELCYAEAQLLQAVLTVAEGEDYSSYVRGTLKIKSCYSSYKLCWQILQRKQFESEQSKVHFESGVQLGTATFNLMVSLLPPRIISLLEFVGFSGNRMYGLTELGKGAQSPGLRAVMCDLTLLIYHLIVIPFIGGAGNINASELIFQKILVTYPNSVWFLALRARSEFLKGRLQHSINAYNRAIIGQHHFKQFRILCYWELMWVHGLNLDFVESAMYAELLVDQSDWSKTTHLYIKAAMLMEIDASDVSPSHLENIENAMGLAPRLRVRIAGKSLPMEKFVAKRCERYRRQGKRLVMPAFELATLWNLFHILTNNKDHLHMIVNIIETKRRAIEGGPRDWMGDYVSDNLALLAYIHGCALTALQVPRQALLELEKVLELKKTIKEDTFLVPYAVCEMAMCYYLMGDMQSAMELLNIVKKKYSGYSLETRLHFRVHARVEIVRSVIGASKFNPSGPGIKINRYFDD